MPKEAVGLYLGQQGVRTDVWVNFYVNFSTAMHVVQVRTLTFDLRLVALIDGPCFEFFEGTSIAHGGNYGRNAAGSNFS